MGREFELKYRANPAQIGAIREKFGEFTAISMETAYYDTPGRELGKRRWTLRRRYENGVSVCTLKVPLTDGSRGEWELECGSITEAVPELCKLSTLTELMTLTAEGVQEVCAARFTRLAKTVVTENAAVELALDQGILLGGGREMPLCEVEVELKDGSDTAAVAFADALAKEFDLTPEPASKYKRALALANTK